MLQAIALGANILGGAMAGRSARKSQKQMAALMRQQLGIAKQQEARSAEMYGRYKQDFVPVENELIDISRTIAQPDYAGVLRRATGDYTRARAQTRAEAARTYDRMGIDPSNPMYMRGVNRTSVADALALSTARNMAREAERARTQDLGYQARMGVANLGRGLPGLAHSASSSASSIYGNQANTWGQLAGSNTSAAGYFMNQAFNRLPSVFPNAFNGNGVVVEQGAGYGPGEIPLDYTVGG